MNLAACVGELLSRVLRLGGVTENGTTKLDIAIHHRYTRAIDDICRLNWASLSRKDLTSVAWGYYYFSVQFRESLDEACNRHPHDQQLIRLHQEECDTSNLSPYPGIALRDERMNHDEYMRRVLVLSDCDPDEASSFRKLGEDYLALTRSLPSADRALSIASYEDGGLEAVFRSMLLAPDWQSPALAAFKHFLEAHILFDSDTEAGHGALARHLAPDDRVLPLWIAFRDLLMSVAPGLARG